MGGVAGVRGYMEGQAYGDTGWRVSIAPQTPQVSLGMVDGTVPFWVRGTAFMDYGEVYRFEDTPGVSDNLHTLRFWGTGVGLTANIGTHIDARLTLAWPLYEPAGGAK